MIRRNLVLYLASAFLAASVSTSMAAEQLAAKPRLVKDVHPGLASGALASASLVIIPGGVLLRSGDLKITQKELDAEIAKAPADVRPQLKKNQFFLLENRAIDSLLALEAKAWGAKTNRQPGEELNTLINAFLQDQAGNVTASEAECKAFFDANKDMMAGATYDQVKDDLKGYLAGQKREEAVKKHIDTLSERTPVEISSVWAVRQYTLAMNNQVDKARKSGLPLMVEFGADGCQPCEMMAPIVAELTKEYSGRLNVEFVHVRKEPVLASRFGISVIPVQVFYDKTGKEVFRHTGFFSKEGILAQLAAMGVK